MSDTNEQNTNEQNVNEQNVSMQSAPEANTTGGAGVSAPKKSHGFLIFLAVVLVIGAVILAVVMIGQNWSPSDSSSEGGSTVSGEVNDDPPRLFYRSADNDDVLIDTELDLSSFGEKFVVTPQVDIDDLELTIRFLDEDRNVLTTHVQDLGNVKEGVQVSFSISLFDLGLSVAWNTKYSSVSVTGGSVSYFA